MDRILVGVAGLLYTIAIVFLASAIVIFSPSLHAPFLDTSEHIATDVAISGYLFTHDESLLVSLTPEEASHMQDVAWLTTTMLYFLAGLIAVLTFMFAHSKREERMAILLSPLLLFLLLQLPAIKFFETFTTSFTTFHHIFFPQGNYAFPFDSVLISTYPETFFSSLAGLIGVVIAAVFMIGFLIAILTQVYKRHRKINRALFAFPEVLGLLDRLDEVDRRDKLLLLAQEKREAELDRLAEEKEKNKLLSSDPRIRETRSLLGMLSDIELPKVSLPELSVPKLAVSLPKRSPTKKVATVAKLAKPIKQPKAPKATAKPSKKPESVIKKERKPFVNPFALMLANYKAKKEAKRAYEEKVRYLYSYKSLTTRQREIEDLVLAAIIRN